MNPLGTCTNGHQWQLSDDGAATCPICGIALPANGAASEMATVLPSAPPEDATLDLPKVGAASRAAPPSPARLAGPTPDAAPERVTVPGYEIVNELGRGGMGVVYQARQTRLRRVVALKMILAAGHAGDADLARFRIEAESIARLQHPHIVQIHEVGEHDGLPYFALEFCAGGSLDKKLAGTPLPSDEAAALLVKLAEGMHAAHQKGVVHRDLKPANVLLAEDGTPKITDFGLAKKLDEVGQTQTGAIMGTPSYMAPEQAEGKKNIGPAADVYALGAILYECLTGRPPFKAATTFDTIMQVVSDEPVPPSRLNAQVPRDVETICLKCLQKDAGKRYGSAAELSDDLRRFRAGEPVRARPVGAWGRMVRWARRKPAVAASLAAAVLLLLAGTGVSTYFAIAAARQAQQALAAKDRAEEAAEAEKKAKESETVQRRQAEAVVKMLESVFRDLDPRAEQKGCFDVKSQLLAQLDAAARTLDTEYADQPLVRARLRNALGVTQLGLGEADKALPLFQAALEERHAHLEPDHPDTLTTMSNLAGAYQHAGQLDKAVQLFEQTLEKQQAKLGPDHPSTLNTMNNLASAYKAAGKLDQAVPLFEQTLEKRKTKLGADHARTLESMGSLGSAYQAAGRLDKAEPLLEQSLEQKKAKLGPDHPHTLTTMVSLASAYQAASNLDKALPLFEQALEKQKAKLGPDHPDTLTSMANLGSAYKVAGKLDRALLLYEQTLAKRKTKLGPDHPRTLNSMNNLAAAYWSARQLAKSVPLFEETLRLSEAKLGPDHPVTLNTMANLGVNYRDAGRPKEAIPLLEEALRRGHKRSGALPHQLAWLPSTLAQTY
jgi:non-specific serine/threonine protein kinase/serine/threonine-protein kinase